MLSNYIENFGMSKKLSEENLIQGIRQDDGKSLSTVYKLYFSSIAHLIISNQGTEQEAKDIYQEAIIVLYEKLKDKSFQLTCQINTFLYSVARRLWLKRLAQKNRYSGKINDFEEFLDMSEESQDFFEQEQQFEAMEVALKDLGEPCKTVLKSFYIDKKSMAEIVELMGYTNTANAKTQKYKCLQRLKKIFFKNYNKNV